MHAARASMMAVWRGSVAAPTLARVALPASTMFRRHASNYKRKVCWVSFVRFVLVLVVVVVVVVVVCVFNVSCVCLRRSATGRTTTSSTTMARRSQYAHTHT